MGRKSSVSRLPAEVKTYIEAMLATGAQTLDELITDLRERWPAEARAGDLPSRSALHRYGSKLDRRLSAIRASTEAAKLIQAQAGDDQDARSEALTALVQTELFEAILMLQEADDAETDPGERVGMLSAAAKNIATLTRSSIGLKTFQAQARARAKAAAETVDKIAKSGGLSGDAAEQIRREILGIAA
jgi:hypothetical protein